MAKRKQSRRITQPAKWFRESVARGRATDTESLEASRRKQELKYLRDAVMDLRKFFKGYEAKDGYSLKPAALARISGAKLRRLKDDAKQLHREMSQPFVVARPRSGESKKAFATHTREKMDKRRKAYIVHVTDPKHTKVKAEKRKSVKGRKRPARVKETLEIADVKRVNRYYYFSDYGPAPLSMDEVYKLVDKMMPDLPKGFYAFMSRSYGNISMSMDRNRLLREIQSTWMVYDKFKDMPGEKDSRGLAEDLIGLRLVATTVAGADLEYNNRITRRSMLRGYRKQVAESQAARKRKRLRGR